MLMWFKHVHWKRAVSSWWRASLLSFHVSVWKSIFCHSWRLWQTDLLQLLGDWVVLLPSMAISWGDKKQKLFPSTFSKRELIFCWFYISFYIVFPLAALGLFFMALATIQNSGCCSNVYPIAPFMKQSGWCWDGVCPESFSHEEDPTRG